MVFVECFIGESFSLREKNEFDVDFSILVFWISWTEDCSELYEEKEYSDTEEDEEEEEEDEEEEESEDDEEIALKILGSFVSFGIFSDLFFIVSIGFSKLDSQGWFNLIEPLFKEAKFPFFDKVCSFVNEKFFFIFVYEFFIFISLPFLFVFGANVLFNNIKSLSKNDMCLTVVFFFIWIFF